MNISSAHTKNLTELSDALTQAKVGSDKEIRAKGGGKVLYEKTSSPGLFSSKAARAKKQDGARDLIGKALEKQFADSPGAKVFPGIVRNNLRSIFEGTGAVTKGDLDRVKAEAERVDTTYNSYRKARDSNKRDLNYEAGRKDATNVLKTVPGFRPDMEMFEGIEKYVEILNGPKPHSADTMKQLGALGAFIRDKGCDIGDVASLKRANEAVDCAVSRGATTIKALPQIVPLNRMGNEIDQQGRCAPLVALAALGESLKPGGMDGVMHRLEQETHEMQRTGRREQSEYGKQLAELHGVTSSVRSPITDSGGKKIGSIGHRKAVEHLQQNPDLAQGKPVMYGVEVRGHIMMIGATKHGGEDSFVFYDPNFGTASFKTADQLTAFMDDYFGSLGYGESYSMEHLKRDGYEFNVAKQYDLTALAGLKVNQEDISTLIAPR
jgi:hypothetical protein